MKDIESLARAAVAELMRAGAEAASCKICIKSCDEANALGQKTYLLREFDSVELSLNAVIRGRLSEYRLNSLDTSAIKHAAEELVKLAQLMPRQKEEPVWKVTKPERSMQAVPGRCPEKLYRAFGTLLATLSKSNPDIVSDSIMSYTDFTEIAADSEGGEYTVSHTECEGGMELCLRRDGICTGKVIARFEPASLELPLIDLGDLRQKLKETQDTLHSRRIPGGTFKGTLILSNGVFFMQLFNAMSVANARIKQGKEGKLSPLLSVMNLHRNDGREQNESEACDYWVRNGTLEDFLDTTDESVLKERSEREARHAEYSHHLTAVEAGDLPYEELLKGVKRGLVLGWVSGAMPDEHGDFSGVAKNSFYVEDGQLLYPVKSTMISGNTYELLNNVEWISRERSMDGDWALMPRIAVDGVSIC